MGTAKPTVERRQLGLTLRRHRERANLSQAAAGRAIGRTAARISQIENGIGVLNNEDLISYLGHLGIRGAERGTLLTLGTAARRRSRRVTYTDNLPGSFQRLADLEADAIAISSYESGIIPGLLQAPEYLRALLETASGVWWEGSTETLQGRAHFRLDQQRRVLHAEPSKALSFVFTEDSLDHVLGGPTVMRSQMLHLLQLVEGQEDLSIQILSNDTADNPLLGGGIMVLDFENAPRIGFASVVYGPSTYHDDEKDTTPMLRAIERVRGLALSPEDSRELILRRLKESWT